MSYSSLSHTSLEESKCVTVSSLKPSLRVIIKLLDEATVREVLGEYLRPEELDGLVDPKELASLIL